MYNQDEKKDVDHYDITENNTNALYNNESLLVISEGHGENKKYILSNHVTKSYIGTYFESSDFFKCTAINLSNIIFDVPHMMSNVFVLGLFNNLKHINCEFNNIENFTHLPNQLETLICGYNKITRLENLPTTLKNITAQHNYIEYVDVSNTNVVNLNLSNNKLSSFDNVQLPNHHMKLVDISYNKLHSVDIKDYSINKLNLNSNIIHAIFSLPNELEILLLCNNFIDTFVLPIKLENKLINLNLTKNNLTKLSGNFNELKDLNVSSNQLNKIEGKFIKLLVIYASSNNIREIDLPHTVQTLCFSNTLLKNLKITNMMDRLYIPFGSLETISPFNKFMNLYKNGNVITNDNDEIHIKRIAACIIQRRFRKFIIRSPNKWQNIYTKNDLNNSDITIMI